MSGISNTVNLNIDGGLTGVLAGRPAPIAIGNATTAITVAQSGSVFIVSQATGSNKAITLPAVAGAAGCTWKFIWNSAADGARTWSITAVGGVLSGSITNNIAAGAHAVSYNGAAGVVRSATAANTSAGDWVKIYSDGTNYYVSGQGTCGPAGGGAATFA